MKEFVGEFAQFAIANRMAFTVEEVDVGLRIRAQRDGHTAWSTMPWRDVGVAKGRIVALELDEELSTMADKE